MVAGIRADGERAFLHVLAANAGAIRLSEAAGFVIRRPVEIVVVRVPAAR